MKQALYFPSISTATVSYMAKKTDKQFIEGSPNFQKGFRFFNKDAGYYYHPHILLSAVHLHNKTNDVREYLDIDNRCNLFIDSGGFQLATGAIKEKNWNNEKAFSWSMNNGNIFPILDRPPIRGIDINKNLKLSYESAEYYNRNRKKGDNKIILNVVHGNDQNSFKKWMNKMAEVNLDGWALGSSHEGNPKAILIALFDMINEGVLTKKDKVLHVFGVSTSINMIYFDIIQKCLHEQGYRTVLTYDSSYFQRSLGFGHYFLWNKFSGITNITFTNKCDYSKIDKNMRPPCDCPVCEGITDLNRYFSNSEDFYMLGILHNLNKMLSYKKSVYNLLNYNVDGLWDYIFPADIKYNLNLIIEAMNNPKMGAEIIKKKFKYKDQKTMTSALPGFELDFEIKKKKKEERIKEMPNNLFDIL